MSAVPFTPQGSLKLLFIGHLVAMAAMEMSGPFWPVYIKTLSPMNNEDVLFWSALVYATPMAVAMIAIPLWGALGDRVGHKTMVLRALLALTVTQGLIAVTSQIEMILVWRLVQGACAGMIAAAMAYAVSLDRKKRRVRVIAALQGCTAAGSLVGPVAGGVIIAYLGYAALFTLSAIVCLLVAVMFAICLMPSPAQQQNSSHREVAQDHDVPRQGSSTLKLMVALVLGAIVIAQLAKMLPQAFFALYVADIAGNQPVLVGITFSLTGVAVLLCAPFWGRIFDRLKPAQTVWCLCFLSLCALMIMEGHAAVNQLETLGVLRFAWGLCLGGLLPGLLNLLAQLAGATGQVLGFGNGFSKFGNLLGYLGGAMAASMFGLAGAFHFISATYAVLIPVLLGLLLVGGAAFNEDVLQKRKRAKS